MSKSRAWWLVLLALVAMFLPAVKTGAAPADGVQPVILIPPFETARSSSAMRGFGMSGMNANDDARGVLEDILVNKHMKVVERERVDAVLKEAEFSGKSTMADQEKAVKMGKMLGANVLAMGTVLNVSSETQQSSGYGVRTRKTTVKASVRIRVVDIASGEIGYSRVCNAQQSYDSSTNGGFSATPNGASFEVVKAAINQVSRDDAFFSALRKVSGAAAAKSSDSADDSTTSKPKADGEKTVEVSFEPTPAKCDVLIDGEYRGTTPLKLTLPVKKSVKITIRKSGFEPWEATMTPSENVKKVNPELGAVKGK